MRIRLPPRFKPTHQTAGLPGFPAIDVFGGVGDLVEAGHSGVVTRLSGRKISGTERPGSAYGFSVYTRTDASIVRRYITHLECVAVEVGDRVSPTSVLGRIAAPPAGSPAGSAHAHYGSTRP